MTQQEPDFIRAKRKLNETTDWRGDVNVSLGDETVTFKHRLLNESEIYEIKQALDMSALSDAQENAGQTDAQERLLELQEKEELSAEEEAELKELTSEVASQTDQIEDALGTDGYNVLMRMGKKTIEPSQADVEYVYDSDPTDAIRHMGVEEYPNPCTKDVVRTHLREQLQSMISNQPYPIKLNVGMQAFSETLSVLGNGLPE